MEQLVEGAGGADGALALPVLDVPKLSRRSSSGDVVRRALAMSTSRLITHDPAVRRGEDGEGVHQARVATRRLRSDLRTFGPLIDAAWSRQLRTELGELAAELGAVRDADVLLARLRADAEQLAEEDRPHLERVLGQLETHRSAARRTLLDSMSSPRYATLLDDLVDATQHPMLSDAARHAARRELRRIAARPWKRLACSVAALPDTPTDAELHRVRIMAKRARYAAEAVVPVLPAALPFARALAGVQTVLGEHQDAAVAEQWLRSATTRSRQEAFAVGALAGVERAAALAARARWRTAWSAATRPRLRAWM
jgi:CHAD domain-containing protein